MIYIVRPREGLRDLPERPSDKGQYFKALLEWRQRELDAVWLRIADTLSLTNEERDGADSYMQTLAGTGHLILDDSDPRWTLLNEKFRRLEHVSWLRVWPDKKLPPQLVLDEQSDDGPAQPWHMATINKPTTLNGSKVSIGVIDYGYDPTLDDLKAPFTAKFADFKSATKTMVTAAPVDHHLARHGSKVCAYLAGTISGVAPSASVFVAAVPVVSLAGNQSTVLVALNWLFVLPTGAHPDRPVGCDIITTSLQTDYPKVYDKTGFIDDALQTAFTTWETLVIGAIGNGGSDKWQCPAASDFVVGVGAVSQALSLAYFSASGDTGGGVFKPDIVAPGYNLELPISGVLHKNLWGTSFAAPIVAAAAALILEKKPALRSNPAGTSAALRTELLGNFTKAIAGAAAGTTGAGLLDLTGL